MKTTVFSLLIFIVASIASAQEFNAGFVQGLWYSQENIFVDDTVRIYVAIRNNTGSDLSGTVEFYDNDTRIGRKTVQALDGRIIESWADWTPGYGEHTLSATLSRIELHKVGSSTQAVEVTSSLADDVVFVDYDTDGDGIGNQDDADDDGDGTDDVQEINGGTDPLKKDAVQTEGDEDAIDRDQIDQDRNESVTENERSKPEGLEQYLSDSPAENVISTVTHYINEARENLDTYRHERSKDTAAATSSVNADGFGNIERATSSESANTQTNIGDFFASVLKVAGALISALYTFILATLSVVLSHPVLLQVGLLILLLFGLVKLASKFGKRPGGKKL